MLSQLHIAFIGSGVMAEAMIQGILNQKLMEPGHIRCADPLPRRGAELHARYGVHTGTDNAAAVQGADIVVLSVKPQVLKEVLAGLRGHIRPEQLVLSIVAGATTRTICAALNHPAVIRVMPNTPARVGQGMSVWIRTPEVSDRDCERARVLLKALGREIQVEHEEELDMATALSGTGPAYVFLFMEALVDAGVHLGFSRRLAEELVLQTVKGSVEFAIQSRDKHLAELRNQVTSPGGTSAEALYQLEKGGLRTIISKAVFAAFKKSQYLSRLSADE
ncbi:MAG TPA: pyrroline-5-carboxylate reductase [Candidatus Nitrosotenuis sp.]|jgi:pyrroline-5-carboxylate reductase|nr:pyrroline-5-carboxylate reductase [Candidatus Nitrosotenuis sp.]